MVYKRRIIVTIRISTKRAKMQLFVIEFKAPTKKRHNDVHPVHLLESYPLTKNKGGTRSRFCQYHKRYLQTFWSFFSHFIHECHTQTREYVRVFALDHFKGVFGMLIIYLYLLILLKISCLCKTALSNLLSTT